MSAISENIDTLFRIFVVYAVIFALFVLNLVSFSILISSGIEVYFIIMAVYYWSIYRPTLIPPVFVFVIGIGFDLLSSLPVGLSSLILLGVREIIVEQRVFLAGQTFAVIWLGFSMVSIIALFVQWSMFGLINFQWTPIEPVLVMILAGICVFPFVNLILNLSHKFLPATTDQYSAVR